MAKKGPFSLTFYQIVDLMFPHRSVVAGRLPIFHSSKVRDFAACFSRTRF